VVASTRHHRAHLLKYYLRRPYVASFVKSRMLRLLQTHFLLFQQIFFVLVCIHPGTPRVRPPQVLASAPKPCGGNNQLHTWPSLGTVNTDLYLFGTFWLHIRHLAMGISHKSTNSASTNLAWYVYMYMHIQQLYMYMYVVVKNWIQVKIILT